MRPTPAEASKIIDAFKAGEMDLKGYTVELAQTTEGVEFWALSSGEDKTFWMKATDLKLPDVKTDASA